MISIINDPGLGLEMDTKGSSNKYSGKTLRAWEG